MRRSALTTVLLVLAAACTLTVSTDTTAVTTTTSTTTADENSTTTLTSEPDDDVAGCTNPTSGFVESGAVGRVGRNSADAVQISSIGLFVEGDCERLEIELTTSGGAPATTLPVVSTEALAGSGIIRLQFDRSVQSTAVADSILEGTLVDRVFVVRGLDSRLFVDIVIADAAAARVTSLRNPARVAVELQPGILPVTGTPAISGDLVVTAPVQPTVEYPVIVDGYTRADPAILVGRILRDGNVETEVQTSAIVTPGTWGQFRLEIEDGPAGNLDLTVQIGTEPDELPVVRLTINAG